MISLAILPLLLSAVPDGGVKALPREPLVEVTSAIADAVVELKYATADNFMKQAVYPPTARCLLLSSAVEKLKVAAETLRKQGFRLKFYDCYRPHSVQYELWKIFPRPGYVMDPKVGSLHNRGAAVDLTVVTLDGTPVEMPTPFDTFTRASYQKYQGGTQSSRDNRDRLRNAMEGAGLKRNPMEWWHFELESAWGYPLRDDPF